MKKLTKIIATVGPASESPEMISKLIDCGVNIFRFNIKHNELPWHEEKVKLVKEIADGKGVAIGTLLDLQGPEIRTVMKEEEVRLAKGDSVIIGEGEGHPTFSISHPQIIKHLEKGQKIVVEDGRCRFEVVEVLPKGAVLKAEQDQTLKPKKTFNIPGASYPMPTLTEKDEEAIKMAAKIKKVDFIALSFVRSAQDILDLKEVMKKLKLVARVIPKVETQLALDNLDEIVAVSEGLMVARGDLGVEIPMEQVPHYQKLMIKKCLERGIPVITATQMLISMFDKPYPTRAEISDVANAAYDFTDTTMLSEESAMGNFPDKAVETMAATVGFSEKGGIVKDTRDVFDYYILDSEEMLCDTAYNLYLTFEHEEQPIGGFIVFSETGRTGRKLSRYRAKAPIFVFTPDEKVRDGLTMSFGVTPFVQPSEMKDRSTVRIEDMKEAFKFLVKHAHVDPDKRYILLYGDSWGVEGGVSTIKIVYPKNLD